MHMHYGLGEKTVNGKKKYEFKVDCPKGFYGKK